MSFGALVEQDLAAMERSDSFTPDKREQSAESNYLSSSLQNLFDEIMNPSHKHGKKFPSTAPHASAAVATANGHPSQKFFSSTPLASSPIQQVKGLEQHQQQRPASAGAVPSSDVHQGGEVDGTAQLQVRQAWAADQSLPSGVRAGKDRELLLEDLGGHPAAAGAAGNKITQPYQHGHSPAYQSHNQCHHHQQQQQPLNGSTFLTGTGMESLTQAVDPALEPFTVPPNGAALAAPEEMVLLAAGFLADGDDEAAALRREMYAPPEGFSERELVRN